MWAVRYLTSTHIRFLQDWSQSSTCPRDLGVRLKMRGNAATLQPGEQRQKPGSLLLLQMAVTASRT